MSQHNEPHSMPGKGERLLNLTGHLSPQPRVHYENFLFQVPAGASKVGLVFSFHKERLAQLFISLHDPNGFRGNRMKPGAKGDVVLELWVSPDSASEGAIPGPLPAGEWRVQLDIERLAEEVNFELTVYADTTTAPAAAHPRAYPEDHIVRAQAGWYQGELHAHSTESDGKYPVDIVVQAAMDSGLDFLSLTDHFTSSQWNKLASLQNQKTALIRSLEITSHQGHANLHGIQEWVDVYVDRPDWSMNQAAQAVHAQGGLFCINHAFSGDLAWRAFDFDWSRADLIEIFHNLEGANNNFHPGFWDLLLSKGMRIIGIGGTDSHDPFTGTDKIAQVVTWVYADELSEKGIIAALKRGKVYISRGPELRFIARNIQGEAAEMGQALAGLEQPVQFEVQVKSQEALRLFIIKNGLLFDNFLLNGADGGTSGDWQSLSFKDTPYGPGYYRLELHRVFKHPKHPGILWRDHETVQAYSNPIWVK